jgi:hypothetical protein
VDIAEEAVRYEDGDGVKVIAAKKDMSIIHGPTGCQICSATLEMRESNAIGHLASRLPTMSIEWTSGKFIWPTQRAMNTNKGIHHQSD